MTTQPKTDFTEFTIEVKNVGGVTFASSWSVGNNVAPTIFYDRELASCKAEEVALHYKALGIPQVVTVKERDVKLMRGEWHPATPPTTKDKVESLISLTPGTANYNQKLASTFAAIYGV